MKTMKLTSMLVMLTMTFGAFAQEEFVDDVYFSSGKSKSKNATKTESVTPVASSTAVAATVTTATTAPSTSAYSEMDVDAYNRRYTSYDAAETFTDDAYYYYH